MGIFPGRCHRVELNMAYSQKISKANICEHIWTPVGAIFYFVATF